MAEQSQVGISVYRDHRGSRVRDVLNRQNFRKCIKVIENLSSIRVTENEEFFILFFYNRRSIMSLVLVWYWSLVDWLFFPCLQCMFASCMSANYER